MKRFVESDDDFDGDRKVDFGDLPALTRNYGQNLTVAQLATFSRLFRSDVERGVAQVPEPQALIVPAVAVALLIRRRKMGGDAWRAQWRTANVGRQHGCL